MTTLTFDVEGLAKALIERLIKVMDILMEEFYRDATSALSAEGKADSERIPATLTDKTMHDAYQVGEFISARCKFYANAIMESFGTGSQSDLSMDAYWKEYEQSILFNRIRREKGNAYITGREAGTYKNIFGEEQTTSGRNVGRNLEHIFPPTPPKLSIQRAEDWIIRDTETKVERRIQVEVERFLAEEAGKYFREVRG